MSRQWLAVLCVAACVPLVGSGCALLEDYKNQQAMRQQAERRMWQAELQRVEGRIEGLEMQNEQIHRELEQLRTRLTAAQQDEQARREQRFEALDDRLRLTEQARQKDKEFMLDELSRRMAEMINKALRRNRPATRPRKQSGVEHVVQPGETISEIAAAYGKKVSSIIKANGITEPDKVKAGQRLFIPD